MPAERERPPGSDPSAPLTFEALELPADRTSLIAFLSSEEWPFHVFRRLPPERVEQMIDDGTFDGSGQRTFWIRSADGQRIGLIRLFDLDDVDDGSPLFDLRIAARHRGRGTGRAALRWLTDYCFRTWPELERMAGTTRVDNRAMRRLFETCGYAKEGHYRRSWRAEGGQRYDTVAYGILREDWASGSVTPVHFHDTTNGAPDGASMQRKGESMATKKDGSLDDELGGQKNNEQGNDESDNLRVRNDRRELEALTGDDDSEELRQRNDRRELEALTGDDDSEELRLRNDRRELEALTGDDDSEELRLRNDRREIDALTSDDDPEGLRVRHIRPSDV